MNMEHKCPYCGAPIPENASFCPGCARSIRSREKVKIPACLRQKWRWLLLGVAGAAAAACFVMLLCGQPAGLPKGEVVPVLLEEDEKGMVKVTPDLLRKYFPGLTGINFSTTSRTSENIDDYLIENLQMANLVASRGAFGADEEEGVFSARSAGTRRCLLIFDRNVHLIGYFVGEPVQVSEGRWRIDVVSCDYDFTELCEEQLAAFETSWREDFSTYIPPEKVKQSGAAWFLTGYNTGHSSVLREDDPQIYHLWATLHASEKERQCREIQRLGEFLPREGRWMCYLLLDQEYTLLGYTLLDSQGSGAGGLTAESDAA